MMPQFGCCTSVASAPVLKAAGWDFVEECVQTFLQGDLPDDQWHNESAARTSALPVLAANMLVPKSLKITGPDADLSRLRDYMSRVTRRAAQCGMKVLVFGSGGAREVPEGFDRDRARQQIVEFATISADLARQNNLMLVVEPLNRKECNIINSIGEAMQYVRDVSHPNFQCLLDTYHFWLENDDKANAAVPFIKHVHVADKDGRVAPGLSGTADYRPIFQILRQGGYQGAISVEATNFDIARDAEKVLAFLKKQWSTCM